MMKLALVFFISSALLAELVFGLAETGRSFYRVTPGSKVCRAVPSACCSGNCTLRYQARGEWVTKQDRVATEVACNGVCNLHFRKCVDMCTCVSRQTEVENTSFCKCKSLVSRIFVRASCVGQCVAARNNCRTNCHTKKCPLKAVTNMEWTKEFRGRCEGICRKENPLTTVCSLTSDSE